MVTTAKQIRFLTTLALTAFGFSSVLHAAPLADFEPSREWRGYEYADMLYSKFKAQNPQLSLTIDRNDLQMFSERNIRVPPESRDTAAKVRVTKDAMNARGKVSGELINTLVDGSSFAVNLAVANQVKVQEALTQWLHNQAPNSLGPEDLMIEALRLTNGHVIAAWAVAWNLTRENWINAQTRNYSEMTNRFISLTGERDLWSGAARYIVRERLPSEPIKALHLSDEHKSSQEIPLMQEVISKRGDDFSTLYHHIGVELLALITSKQTNTSLTGGLTAVSGALGEYANFRKTAGLPLESRKRLINDLHAGRSGAHLFDLFTGRSKPRPNIIGLGPKYYLRPNSLFFGRNYQLATDDDRPSAYFRRKIDARFWAPVMPPDELLLRFHHAASFDSAVINDIVVSAGNGDSERLHLGLQAYIDSGMPNDVLNQLILDFNPEFLVIPSPRDVTADFDSNISPSAKHLGSDFSEFSFEEAAVRQKRMIEKTQTAIRMKIETAKKTALENSARRAFCSGAF